MRFTKAKEPTNFVDSLNTELGLAVAVDCEGLEGMEGTEGKASSTSGSSSKPPSLDSGCSSRSNLSTAAVTDGGVAGVGVSGGPSAAGVDCPARLVHVPYTGHCARQSHSTKGHLLQPLSSWCDQRRHGVVIIVSFRVNYTRTARLRLGTMGVRKVHYFTLLKKAQATPIRMDPDSHSLDTECSKLS